MDKAFIFLGATVADAAARPLHWVYDPKKLKSYTNEYWNGDDVVENIEYNGVDIDNQGGDTTGKGYSGHFWKNVGDE